MSSKNINCEIEVTLDCIGGKWKALILWYLCQYPCLRFGQFKRLIPGVSNKVLTNQLRELEEMTIIQRHIYAEVPPRVEYLLTERGKTLEPLLQLMCKWGRQNDDLGYNLSEPLCRKKLFDE